MIPNLAAGNRVLQQALSDPNVYGAIFNNQTYGYGHGKSPQDYAAGHTGDPVEPGPPKSRPHLVQAGQPGNIDPSGTPPMTAGGGAHRRRGRSDARLRGEHARRRPGRHGRHRRSRHLRRAVLGGICWRRVHRRRRGGGIPGLASILGGGPTTNGAAAYQARRGGGGGGGGGPVGGGGGGGGLFPA